MAQRDIKTLILMVGSLLSSFCLADDALVAVANNFHRPAQIIAAHFKQQTGHQILLSTGSTGQIYSQITHGAPYDVFLSADQKRPALLVQKQIATEQITYAKGRIVLWSPDKALFSDGQQALVSGEFEHIAVANPKVAPYGMASVQVMESLGVYPQLESKLVMGKGLNATYQYLVTGNAELGFLAMSQVVQNGSVLE
ncbi:molybdate ABC transporter substrate-binding protein, partial [Vibrio sp. M260118]|uniref:molybdate ABC transporter substrate-binding protein n=1 Tax=Vibrio sp. M260118 TaxID=3020896 RepID=UPI002F3EDC5E